MNSRQHLHLASQDASLWGEQCLHPRTAHNKRGSSHSVCIFTSTMPSDCLPSWAKSPAAINQGTSIYSGCSLSSVSELSGLSALKIHLGATNVRLLPGFVSAREKGSREGGQWISAHDGCQPCQSAAMVGKRWALTQCCPCEQRGGMRLWKDGEWKEIWPRAFVCWTNWLATGLCFASRLVFMLPTAQTTKFWLTWNTD